MTETTTKPHFSLLATSFAGGPPPRRAATIILGLWLVLFFAALFTPPLLDDADATHAQAARAMATTGDLVTLRVNGVRYLEKAPLPYWLAAAAFKIFGFNTFAAHLPQALAVLLLALLGHRWANQAFGSRTGFYTAIAILTSAGVFLFTRILIPEVLLSLTLAAALFAFLKTLGPIAPEGVRFTPRLTKSSAAAKPLEQPSDVWYAGPAFYAHVMWASLALAVLAKGLVALVFFLATALLFLALTGDLRKLKLLRPVTGVLLFLAIAAPWHVLAGLRNQGGADGHGFWWFYFWNEHVLRFLGHRIPADYNRIPGWLYWSMHLLWLFPWTLFLPLGITAFWRRTQHQELLTKQASGSTGAPSFPASSERVGYRASGSTALPDRTPHPEPWNSTPNRLPLLPRLHLLLALVMMSTIYPITRIFGVDPISLLLLEGVAGLVLLFAIRRRRSGLTPSPFHRLDPQQRTILLLALFSAIVLLFFSLSTNQEYYTFPAYLPLLLLIAATITRAEQTYSSNPSAVRWVTFAHAAFTTLGLLAALALAYGLFNSRNLPYNPDLGAALAHRGIGSYTLATSHLFDLTTQSFAGLRLPAVLAALALALGPPAAWVCRAQRRHLAATTTIALTMAAFLFSAHLAFARFAPLLSSKSFADVIQQSGCFGGPCSEFTPIILFGDQSYGSSIPFYLGRPVYLVDGRTTSMAFGSTFDEDITRHVFLTRETLLQAWSKSHQVLLFVPAERRDEVLRLLPPNPTILRDESGKLLLTNQLP